MPTIRHLEEGDRDRIAHLQKQAFVLPPERVAMAGAYPLHEGWVVEADGVVQGALRAQKLGQFFGGRPVSCAAVSSVKVAAEARGRGLGGALLGGALRALREDGCAWSTLFPVHQGVYRRFGWETAFAFRRRRLPLPEVTVNRSLSVGDYEVGPWDDEDLDEVAGFYREHAAGQNGLFDRTADWWRERVLAPRHGRVPYRYLARVGGRVAGYLLYTHEPAGESHPYAFALECRDFFWSDPQAAAALLRFVAGHAGMGTAFSWPGSAADPLDLLLTGMSPMRDEVLSALGRMVDVGGALEARGYPSGLTAVIELDVADDTLPENAGPIRLEISGGRGRTEPAGGGGVEVDVRTLAAMFTGWLDAGTAASLGLLGAADEATIEMLRRAFAGPAAWMSEAY